MSHSILLEEFGELIGIDLKFDENHQCLLQLDDRLLVSIHYVGGNYIFYGMLGEFPDNDEAVFWKNVLSVNKDLAESNSGTICFEESTDVLLLIKSVGVQGIDATKLKKIVEDFVSTVEKLIGFFTSERDLPGSDADFDDISPINEGGAIMPYSSLDTFKKGV